MPLGNGRVKAHLRAEHPQYEEHPGPHPLRALRTPIPAQVPREPKQAAVLLPSEGQGAGATA